MNRNGRSLDFPVLPALLHDVGLDIRILRVVLELLRSGHTNTTGEAAGSSAHNTAPVTWRALG